MESAGYEPRPEWCRNPLEELTLRGGDGWTLETLGTGSSCNKSLRHLALERYDFFNYGGSAPLCFSQLAPSLGNLQSLSIRSSILEVDTLAFLCSGLPLNLKSLDLSGNGQLAEPDASLGGVKRLASWIYRCTALGTLNLSHCNLPSKAGRIILDAVSSCNSLRTLLLSHNKLDDECIVPFVSRPCHCLSKLDLSSNRLSGNSVQALARALTVPLSTAVSESHVQSCHPSLVTQCG